MKKPEQNLQKQLCQWIRIQYPDIYFMSDASGLPIGSWGLRNLLKTTRSKHAALDLVILEPRGEYHGLVIELKAKSPYQKDSVSLKNDEHLLEQAKSMRGLHGKNYQVGFIWDFEQGIKYINEYLKQTK